MFWCIYARMFSGAEKYQVLVKGSPEAIEKLLDTVPPHYTEAYTRLTKQGMRVMAFAYRNISGKVNEVMI